MRPDAVGIFWQDYAAERSSRGERTRPLPPIPDTGWRPPTDFPRLEAAKVLAIDTETKDPELRERGPGFQRGDACVVGLAVGTDDGHRWYFPMRHEVGGGNMDPDMVLRWARDELGRATQPKVGANLLYDLEALAAEGVHVAGELVDVQAQESLLDEHREKNLDALGERYLQEGKAGHALYQWCADAYGGRPGHLQRANIYRAPAALVGPYAEGDVDLPLRIMQQQRVLLAQQGMIDLAYMENGLLPMLLAMRRRGVRIDTAGADQLDSRIGQELEALRKLHGVEPWNAGQIAARCDALGLPYPNTAKGAPSFTAAWLKAQSDPFLLAVARMRALDKMRGTFVQGHIMGHLVGDRVHCQFHALKGDDYGAVSGRFSSSNPNLQNIPSRDDELAPLLRGLFLPEPGEDWVRFDWSQIEFRLLVHYARGKGAAEAVRRYNEEPDTDFHQMVNEWVFGGDPSMRKPSKNINFGLVYGMGKNKLAAQIGRSPEAAEQLFATYHGTLPFVKDTFDAAAQMASNRGYVSTLMGRRARFDLYEPRDWKKAKEVTAVSRDAVPEDWLPVRRAYTHKALNRILQGGAADIMKRAMLDIWNSGVCDVLGAPLVTVHDELGWSAPRTEAARAALAHAQHIMETCVKLKVPLVAEREQGADWGHLSA